MLNTVSVIGRLGADVEVRQTQMGKSIASFAIAVDRDRKNPDGTRTADWVPCVAWNETAEFLGRHANKGMMLAIFGRLQVREWKEDSGAGRKVMEVMVKSVYFPELKKTYIPVTPAMNSESGDSATVPESQHYSAGNVGSRTDWPDWPPNGADVPFFM